MQCDYYYIYSDSILFKHLEEKIHVHLNLYIIFIENNLPCSAFKVIIILGNLSKNALIATEFISLVKYNHYKILFLHFLQKTITNKMQDCAAQSQWIQLQNIPAPKTQGML